MPVASRAIPTANGASASGAHAPRSGRGAPCRRDVDAREGLQQQRARSHDDGRRAGRSNRGGAAWHVATRSDSPMTSARRPRERSVTFACRGRSGPGQCAGEEPVTQRVELVRRELRGIAEGHVRGGPRPGEQVHLLIDRDRPREELVDVLVREERERSAVLGRIGMAGLTLGDENGGDVGWERAHRRARTAAGARASAIDPALPSPGSARAASRRSASSAASATRARLGDADRGERRRRGRASTAGAPRGAAAKKPEATRRGAPERYAAGPRPFRERPETPVARSGNSRHLRSAFSMESPIVSSTRTRAHFLSFASMRCHGATSVLVRSTISQTARSYAGHFFRLRQSSGVILKRLNGVFSRARNRASCSLLADGEPELEDHDARASERVFELDDLAVGAHPVGLRGESLRPARRGRARTSFDRRARSGPAWARAARTSRDRAARALPRWARRWARRRSSARRARA